MEKEYILRAEHQRVVSELERKLRQEQRSDHKSPGRQQTDNGETLRQILTDKYEQALKRQAEKYEAEIELLKSRIRLLEKDISLASVLNQSLHESSKLTSGAASSLSDISVHFTKKTAKRTSDRNNEEERRPESPIPIKKEIVTPSKQSSTHSYFADSLNKSKFQPPIHN